MKSFFSAVGKAFRSVDLFPTSKLIRYNGDAEYTSTTGGIISVLVIAIFIVLFASMGIRTIRKEIIQTETEVSENSDPSELKIKLGPEGGMIPTIFLNGFNLTHPPRAFNISLMEDYHSPGYLLQNSTPIPLVQCTEEHFSFSK